MPLASISKALFGTANGDANVPENVNAKSAGRDSTIQRAPSLPVIFRQRNVGSAYISFKMAAFLVS